MLTLLHAAQCLFKINEVRMNKHNNSLDTCKCTVFISLYSMIKWISSVYAFMPLKFFTFFLATSETDAVISKTSFYLSKVLEDKSLVDEFNKEQNIYKRNSLHKDNLMKLAAKIEVKLQLTLEEAQAQLAKLEKLTFGGCRIITVEPDKKEDKNKYVELKNKIKIISCLMNHFSKL